MVSASHSSRRTPQRRGSVAHWRARPQPQLSNGYLLYFVGPNSGISTRDRRPNLSIFVRSALGSPVDVQVEWRRDAPATQTGNPILPSSPWVPAPVYSQTINDAASGSVINVEPPADLLYRTWYYRARAGNVDTNQWSDWTPQFWLDVQPVLGSTAGYVEANIGVENVPHPLAVAYMEMNIGVDNADQYVLTHYMPLNVGVIDAPKIEAAYIDANFYPPPGEYRPANYVDINAVSDETPVPHIWWIRPEEGREGLIFNIYGHGFGAFQGEYSGEVRLGALVCSIARWETLPAQYRSAEVRVTGLPATAESAGNSPSVQILDSSVVLEEGDIIQYDLRWDTPSATRLNIFPNFSINGTNQMGYSPNLLNDQDGRPWIADIPEAYGAYHTRTFVVPPGNSLIGKTISNFRLTFYGAAASGSPARTGSIRSMSVRSASGDIKLWVTGDDELTVPSLTYLLFGGVIESAEYERSPHFIEQGLALDPDTITPEHGWIVAIVPSGAVSAPVKVVLEEP